MLIRPHLLYPLIIVAVLLGSIAVYAVTYYEPDHSPSIILQTGDGVTRLTISEIEDRATIKPIGVHDVWNEQDFTYGCVEIYDLLDVFDALPESTADGAVVLTNIQGKTVSLSFDEIRQRNKFYLALSLEGEILESGFSQSPSAGGPLRVVIREQGDDQVYGPEYLLWCVYKIEVSVAG
jgi:hypothetical protein